MYSYVVSFCAGRRGIINSVFEKMFTTNFVKIDTHLKHTTRMEKFKAAGTAPSSCCFTSSNHHRGKFT